MKCVDDFRLRLGGRELVPIIHLWPQHQNHGTSKPFGRECSSPDSARINRNELKFIAVIK